MSVYLIARVFATPMSSHGDKLVLLSLADFAWDDGTRCYPSIDRLAKHGSLSPRQVYRCLKSLEDHGYIVRKPDLSPVGTTMYSLNVDRLGHPVMTPCHGVTPPDISGQLSQNVTPDTMSPNPLLSSRSNTKTEQKESSREGMTFQVPASILSALAACAFLDAASLRSPKFWQAQIKAHDVEYEQEIAKADAWCVANPHKAPRKYLNRFLASWLARAAQ